jgi:hypothetical protein
MVGKPLRWFNLMLLDTENPYFEGVFGFFYLHRFPIRLTQSRCFSSGLQLQQPIVLPSGWHPNKTTKKGVIKLLFLPYESYEITSSALPEEIMAGLSADTETNPPLFPLFYNGGKSFKGKISREHFVISRIGRGRNYFLPKIEGAVTQHDTGSRINIVISNKSIIYGLIIVGLLFWAPFGKFQERMLAPEGISVLAICYLLFIVFFNVEVNRAKKLLGRIIK